MTSEILFWLALCVYHEARSEPLYDQLLVARTVINRSRDSGLSIPQIIKKPRQYSFLLTSGIVEKPRNLKSWKRALVVANVAFLLSYENKVKWYHTKSVKPKWRHNLKKHYVGKTHIYYRR